MSVAGNYRGEQLISIVSFRSDVTALIADLNYRQGSTEGDEFPQDLVSDEVKIEGMATLNVSARFQIVEYVSGTYKVQREGNMVVTNKFMDDLNDLFLTDTVPARPNEYTYIHWGTGTTPAQEDDTQIETAQGSDLIASGYKLADGIHYWANGAAATSEEASIVFRIPQGDVGGTFSAVTELTLQETSSGSSKTAVRATFPAFTPEVGQSVVEIVIAIIIRPEPGACVPTTNFLTFIEYWLRDQAIAFPKITRIAFFGTDAFSYPSIWLETASETGGKVVTCPALESQVSLTTTQLKQKFMIKYEQTYTFDYAHRYNSADGDQLVAWIGATSADNERESYINIFFRTQKLLSDYASYDTKIVMWLKFARVDIAKRRWLCVPRARYGACI
jgi:hypothetical protein